MAESGSAPPGRAGIEALLVDLGRSLDLPAGPDPTAAVLARLASTEDHPAGRAVRFPGRRRRSALPGWRRRPVRMAAAAVAALALLVAVTPAGRAAISGLVDALGVVLRLGAPTAPERPERLPGETPVTGSTGPSGGPSTGPSGGPSTDVTTSALEQARDLVDFSVVVPAALGRPDQVLVSDGGRVLSLVYRPGPGRPPAGPGGVSARLDEFDGTLEPFFAKTLPAPAEQLELPGIGTAFWIDQPHDVAYLGRDGTSQIGSARLAARTLIWQVGSVTLRLEGDFTRDQALAVAASTA